MERVTGIEPALPAWEAEVLPLNYTRVAPVDVRLRCVRKSNPDSGRLRKSISELLTVSVPVLWRVHDAQPVPAGSCPLHSQPFPDFSKRAVNT